LTTRLNTVLGSFSGQGSKAIDIGDLVII